MAYYSVSLEDYTNSSLIDLLTDKIREYIFCGKYPPGSHLVIKDLSEDLGVSHTPIKEALNRLVTEGYVVPLPRRGMIVKKFSLKEQLDKLEIRLMCELYCVDTILKEVRTNPLFLEKMRGFIREFEANFNTGIEHDYSRWMDLEIRFHSSYVSLCDNMQLQSLYNSLNIMQNNFYVYLQHNSTMSEARFQQNARESKEIVDAMAALDRDRLCAAFTTHIYNVVHDFHDDGTVAEASFWQKAMQN